MKNLKLVFIAAILCGFALSVNAQSDSRAFENYWWLKVKCNGVSDWIHGPVNGHVVDHYNPITGVFEWYKFNFQGKELISMNTGEVFSCHFFQKGKLVDDRFDMWRFNLKGSEGSHILVTIIWTLNPDNGTWTVERKTKCL